MVICLGVFAEFVLQHNDFEAVFPRLLRKEAELSGAPTVHAWGSRVMGALSLLVKALRARGILGSARGLMDVGTEGRVEGFPSGGVVFVTLVDILPTVHEKLVHAMHVGSGETTLGVVHDRAATPHGSFNVLEEGGTSAAGRLFDAFARRGSLRVASVLHMFLVLGGEGVDGRLDGLGVQRHAFGKADVRISVDSGNILVEPLKKGVRLARDGVGLCSARILVGGGKEVLDFLPELAEVADPFGDSTGEWVGNGLVAARKTVHDFALSEGHLHTAPTLAIAVAV